MARGRFLKPGFFTNDELAEIPPLGRILFQGLWCLADRAGRLLDRPRRIKMEVLPYDECDVDMLLAALHERGFIIRYAVAGQHYIQVTNFSKHQSPHKREPASILPAPDAQDAGTVLDACEADANLSEARPDPKLEPKLEPSPSGSGTRARAHEEDHDDDDTHEDEPTPPARASPDLVHPQEAQPGDYSHGLSFTRAWPPPGARLTRHGHQWEFDGDLRAWRCLAPDPSPLAITA